MAGAATQRGSLSGVQRQQIQLVGNRLRLGIDHDLDVARAEAPAMTKETKGEPRRNLETIHQDMAAPDEFSIRGRARLIPQGELRDRVATGWYFEVDDTYWLFELQVQSAILGERAADEWPPRYRRWSAAGG